MSGDPEIHLPTEAIAFVQSAGVIGVTGHRLNRLTPHHEAEMARIAEGLFEHADDDATLLSCMAEGVDTILAEAWPSSRDLMGLLPTTLVRWRVWMAKVMDPARFDALALRADMATLGQDEEPDFVALSRALVDRSDRIIAVWDGADGKPGGTGSVVARARALGKPVLHLMFTEAGFVWPRPSVLAN